MDRNEAIEIVQRNYPTDKQTLNNALEFLIQELKKSEDERIKEELISALKWANYKGVYDKHIAWLEKQSTPQIRTGLEWVNTIDDACAKRYSEEYAHGEYCHEQSFKWGFQEGVKWLEKQGENNQTDEEKIEALRTEYEKGRAEQMLLLIIIHSKR